MGQKDAQKTESKKDHKMMLHEKRCEQGSPRFFASCLLLYCCSSFPQNEEEIKQKWNSNCNQNSETLKRTKNLIRECDPGFFICCSIKKLRIQVDRKRCKNSQ